MLKKVNQKLIFRLHGISSIPYTKRNLVVKPEEAITDDHISCCICGRKIKNLNAKHLASHDIDMDSYKKLCGYAPDTKLISASLLMQLQENVLKAQQGREAKDKANADKNQPAMVDYFFDRSKQRCAV